MVDTIGCHSKTITWFVRIYRRAKPLCFGSQLESVCNLTMTTRLFARQNMTYSVLSTEGGLNVNVGHIVFTHVWTNQRHITRVGFETHNVCNSRTVSTTRQNSGRCWVYSANTHRSIWVKKKKWNFFIPDANLTSIKLLNLLCIS